MVQLQGQKIVNSYASGVLNPNFGSHKGSKTPFSLQMDQEGFQSGENDTWMGFYNKLGYFGTGIDRY